MSTPNVVVRGLLDLGQRLIDFRNRKTQPTQMNGNDDLREALDSCQRKRERDRKAHDTKVHNLIRECDDLKKALNNVKRQRDEAHDKLREERELHDTVVNNLNQKITSLEVRWQEEVDQAHTWRKEAERRGDRIEVLEAEVERIAGAIRPANPVIADELDKAVTAGRAAYHAGPKPEGKPITLIQGGTFDAEAFGQAQAMAVTPTPLGKALDEQADEIQDLKNALTRLREANGGNVAEINRARQRIQELDSENRGHKNLIGNLNQEMTKRAERIKELESELLDRLSDLEGAERDNEALRNSVRKLEAKVALTQKNWRAVGDSLNELLRAVWRLEQVNGEGPDVEIDGGLLDECRQALEAVGMYEGPSAEDIDKPMSFDDAAGRLAHDIEEIQSRAGDSLIEDLRQTIQSLEHGREMLLKSNARQVRALRIYRDELEAWIAERNADEDAGPEPAKRMQGIITKAQESVNEPVEASEDFEDLQAELDRYKGGLMRLRATLELGPSNPSRAVLLDVIKGIQGIEPAMMSGVGEAMAHFVKAADPVVGAVKSIADDLGITPEQFAEGFKAKAPEDGWQFRDVELGQTLHAIVEAAKEGRGEAQDTWPGSSGAKIANELDEALRRLEGTIPPEHQPANYALRIAQVVGKANLIIPMMAALWRERDKLRHDVSVFRTGLNEADEARQTLKAEHAEQVANLTQLLERTTLELVEVRKREADAVDALGREQSTSGELRGELEEQYQTLRAFADMMTTTQGIAARLVGIVSRRAEVYEQMPF